MNGVCSAGDACRASYAAMSSTMHAFTITLPNSPVCAWQREMITLRSSRPCVGWMRTSCNACRGIKAGEPLGLLLDRHTALPIVSPGRARPDGETGSRHCDHDHELPFTSGRLHGCASSSLKWLAGGVRVVSIDDRQAQLTRRPLRPCHHPACSGRRGALWARARCRDTEPRRR